MDQQLMQKILKHRPAHIREDDQEAFRLREVESQCLGFCRLIKFSETAPSSVKNLACTMVLAVLGAQELNAPTSRTAVVVKDTPALIVTKGYVGVCCTGMKKLCDVFKKHILRELKVLAPLGLSRDTDYDGYVVPCFRLFPHNAEACEKIIDSHWNPPVEVVTKWVEMCIPETWTHTDLTRVIGLKPLELKPGDRVT